MENFTYHFLDEDNDDELVHPSKVCIKHKLAVIEQLNKVLSQISNELERETNTEKELYRMFLLLCHGDLGGREFRGIETLDYIQLQQVYDYITIVLEIPLPDFEKDYVAANEHLWKFFCYHKSSMYRTTYRTEYLEYLTTQWKMYDTEYIRLKKIFEEKYPKMIEYFYFTRSRFVANHELESLKKSSEITRKFYNPVRGYNRLQKLLSSHPERGELHEIIHEWKEITKVYFPTWINGMIESLRFLRNDSAREKNRKILQEVFQTSDVYMIHDWMSTEEERIQLQEHRAEMYDRFRSF